MFRAACFNTQPPEGGWYLRRRIYVSNRSFNTQPPEGGWIVVFQAKLKFLCFNTQPPEGGWGVSYEQFSRDYTFQHTAARRRLAGRWRDIRLPIQRFNTQPPEGGWQGLPQPPATPAGFNTQPPEGGWHRGH